MPIKYAKKKPYKKMPYKKKMYRKKSYGKKSLVNLIRTVSLKQSETKNTHQIFENVQLYHNVVNVISTSLLYLEQGIKDDDTGLQKFDCRIGDEVVARGISLKLWFANKLDRPDVMYRVVVFKYRSNTAINSALDPYVSQGTANFMIRDFNVEKFKIIKTFRFKISTSAQRITSTDTFQGAEGHRAINMWIPLKNKKIKYEDGGQSPLFIDYGFSVVAYDSYGTLTTDNIASIAFNRKFYFKDP